MLDRNAGERGPHGKPDHGNGDDEADGSGAEGGVVKKTKDQRHGQRGNGRGENAGDGADGDEAFRGGDEDDREACQAEQCEPEK